VNRLNETTQPVAKFHSLRSSPTTLPILETTVANKLI